MCSIKDTCRPAHHGGAISAVGWGMKLLPPSSGGWSRLVGRSTWPVTGDGKDEVLTSHKMCFFSWVTVSGGFISFRVANVFTRDGKTDFGNVLTHYFFIFYFLLTAFVSATLQLLPWILLKAAEQRARAHFPPMTMGMPILYSVLPFFLVPSLETEHQKQSSRGFWGAQGSSLIPYTRERSG